MNELNKFRSEKHKEALEAFSKAERQSWATDGKIMPRQVRCIGVA